MKKTSKVIVIVLAVICVLAAAFLLLWQWDVFGFFKDYKAIPAITLVGDTAMTVEGGSVFKEPGFSAKIGEEDATEAVQTDYHGLDTTKPGNYEITYTLTNLKGLHEVIKTRTVTVADTTAPVIKLNGKETVRVQIGNEYKEEGVVATDIIDGDLSKNVKIESTVDVNKKGKYTVTYSVADAAGNKASATREVVVFKQSPGSIVYLTFDDGPSFNTVEILDLLKKYHCHATFFVVGQNISGNEDILKRMADEGHTIAVHTYTHNYASIYSSEKAFWEDNEKTRALIKDITGVEAVYMRFPGGASNTISANYTEGIMSALTKQTKEHGYAYFDWNISSGDANMDGLPARIIYENMMDGIHQNYNTPVVLMHDSAAKETTVTAVKKLLKVGLSEGYSFEAIDETVTPVHHAVNN